jgi:hypothetical protein
MIAAASLASVLRGEVTEEQALTFYDQSYRHSYLRLMLIVSGMYQQYNGKDSYFWQAQQLTNNDYEANPDMQLAFVQVVSGMEDLKDSEQTPRDQPVAEVPSDVPQDKESFMEQHVQSFLAADQTARQMVMYRVYESVVTRYSLSADAALGGFYVTAKPRLGLARV